MQTFVLHKLVVCHIDGQRYVLFFESRSLVIKCFATLKQHFKRFHNHRPELWTETELWIRHGEQAFSGGHVANAAKLLGRAAATDKFVDISSDAQILQELGEPTDLGSCCWQSCCCCLWCCFGGWNTADSRNSSLAVYSLRDLK
jgi:hypothetical protein